MKSEQHRLWIGISIISIYLFTVCIFIFSTTKEKFSLEAVKSIFLFAFKIYGPVVLIILLGIGIYLVIKKIIGFDSPKPFIDGDKQWYASLMGSEQTPRQKSKAIHAIILLTVSFVIMWTSILIWLIRSI